MVKKEKICFPIVVGTNHQHSELSFRDRLFIEKTLVGSFLAAIRDSGLYEVLLLSTCDRVEVFCVHEKVDEVFEIFSSKLAEHAHTTREEVCSVLYQHAEFDAVHHIFKVAASLDSAVIGEPQILGQVKAAHRLARELGTVGSELESTMQAAYASAKRVRTETAIGQHSISILSTAIDLAHNVFGDLSQTQVLLIGIGYMGEMLSNELLSEGAQGISITDPVASRGRTILKRIRGHFSDFSDLENLVAKADIIVSSVGTHETILSEEVVRRSLLTRRRRQQLLLDVAVPSDIDTHVNHIENVFLYDLLDLENLAMEGQRCREGELDAASDITLDEARAFINNQAEREATPAVTMLREKFEAERLRVLSEAKGDADKATRLLINRLLHEPTVFLKKAAVTDTSWIEGVRWIKHLFNLSSDSFDQEKDP